MARPILKPRPGFRPKPVAGPVGADNTHFSDSDSSSNDGLLRGGADGSDDSEPRRPAQGTADDLRSGRRIRRSWGIPSLISKQGSKSNLGIDTGIARAHELISQTTVGSQVSRVVEADPSSRRLSSSGRASPEMQRHSGVGARSNNSSGGGGSNNTNSSSRGGNLSAAAVQSRLHQPPLADNPTLDSVSSSEGDMTWEDFLATTDDGTASGTAGKAGTSASSAAPIGRRRVDSVPSLSSTNNPSSPRNRMPHSLVPNPTPVNRIKVSAGSGLGLGRLSDSSVSAGATAGVVMRTVAPSSGGNVAPRGGGQGTLLSSRSKEAGASYPSGLTSWGSGVSQEPEFNDDAESEDSAESDTESTVAAPAVTWGQFMGQRHKEARPPPGPVKILVAPDPPRKASADSDDFDDDEDDDIDDIMSTFGPVSLRPDQDDILFSHKEEELLLMMDRSSELGKGRGPGIDIVAVARASGKAPVPAGAGNIGGADGRGNGNGGGGGGKGVSTGFFRSGGGASGSIVVGKIAGGIRSVGVGGGSGGGGGGGGRGSTQSPPQSSAGPVAAATGGGSRKRLAGGGPSSIAHGAPPPTYSSLTLSNGGNGGGTGVSRGGFSGRGASRGVRRSEEEPGVLSRLGGGVVQTQAQPGQQTQHQIRRRPRANSAEPIKQSDEPRPVPATRALETNDVGRSGISLADLRRADARRKEADRQVIINRAASVQQAHAAAAKMLGGSSDPPPYPGGAEQVVTSKGGARQAPIQKSETERVISPTRCSTTTKLTANALKKLGPSSRSPALAAPEARESNDCSLASKPSQGYWGQRSRTRDTLHTLIEHAPMKSMSSNGGASQTEPGTRERSATEDSQVRPNRRRTGSGDAEIPLPSEGSRGGGEVVVPQQDLAGTAAAAIRSAMLHRHDSAASRETAATTVSSSSHVFRTVSSVSTVRTSTDMTDGAPAAVVPQPSEKRPSSTVEQLHAKAGAMTRRLTPGNGSGGRLSLGGVVDVSQRAVQSAQAAQATLKRFKAGGGTEVDGKAGGAPRDVTDERIKHVHRFTDTRARGQARARIETRANVEVKEKGDGKGKSKATTAEARKVTASPPPPPLPPLPLPEAAPPTGKMLQEKQAAGLEAPVAERVEGPVRSSRDKKKGLTVAAAQLEPEARARAVAEADTVTIAQRRRQQADADAAAAETRKQKLAEVHAAEERRRALLSGEAERERAGLLKAKAEMEARRSRVSRVERQEKEKGVRKAKAAAAAAMAAALATAAKLEKDKDQESHADKGVSVTGASGGQVAVPAPEKKQENGLMKKGRTQWMAPSSGYSLWAPNTPRQEPSATVAGEPRETVSFNRGGVSGAAKVDSRTTAAPRSISSSTNSNGVAGGSKQPVASSDGKAAPEQSFSSGRSVLSVTKVGSHAATVAPFATTDSNVASGDPRPRPASFDAKPTATTKPTAAAKPTVSTMSPPKSVKGNTSNPVIAIPTAAVVEEGVSSTDENGTGVTTPVTTPMDKDQALELDIPYASVVSAETDVAVTLDAAPTPLSQRERDENVLRAHLASWRFCFHEAAALLTPVLGAGNVETPHGGVSETAAREVDSGTAGGANGGLATAGGFLVAPSEEIDLQSELWGKLVQAEALMLQTMLSMSSGATKDTVAACQAVSETLEVSLPSSQNKSTLQEEIAIKLAGAADVVRSKSPNARAAPPEALAAVSVAPTLAEQSVLIELEVLMVRVAMQLMAGQVIKAAATIRKVIKGSHWLLQAIEQDTKAAKKSRDKAQAAAAGGVGLLQSLFFNKKPSIPANAAPTPRPGQRSDGSRDASGLGKNSVNGGSSGPQSNGEGGAGAHSLIEEAVPDDFAGRSWEGYLHHVNFLVALLHVGTSLMPKNLIKILGHYLGYTPSFERGLSLLASCCNKRGMRRPCAAAVLELLVFRELKREAKMMKAGNAPKAGSARIRQQQQEQSADESHEGKRGFRRRIHFRQPGAASDARGSAGGGGGGAGGARDEAVARATALDTAQVALESFYSKFPVVPLLSVPHAKALQASGEFEEAYELCLMAQEVVDQSVLKGEGMGPAHDPHILWLQLAQSSFFLQRWERALDFFTRIVEGVSRVCEKDQRGMTGLSAAYAAASMCGVLPVKQEKIHKLMVVACAAIKKQEAAGAKEHPGLRHRLEAHTARGSPGAELWLFEVLYLHNASAANGMPATWHQSMLDLLQETPVAEFSRAFPQEGVTYTPSETDAIMAHRFTEGLVLYKLEKMEDALEKFDFIVESSRDRDEPTSPRKVLLTESRFVLPHALYLTAVLSYRLRPFQEQLYVSHRLCVRAKRIRDYDFDCQVKISNLMASLKNYMDTLENATH